MKILLSEEQYMLLCEKISQKLTPKQIETELKRIKRLSKGYTNNGQFKIDYPKEARFLYGNKLTNKVFKPNPLIKPKNYWNVETATKEAKKYKNYQEFYRNSNSAYKFLSDSNLLHVVFPNVHKEGADYYYQKGLKLIKKFIESKNYDIDTLKILNSRTTYDLKRYDDENPTKPLSNIVYTKIKKIIKDNDLDNPSIENGRNKLLNVLKLVKNNFELKQKLFPKICGNIGRFVEDPNNIHVDFLKLLPITRVYHIINEHDTQYPNKPWLSKFLKKFKKICQSVATSYETKEDFKLGQPKLYNMIRYHDQLFPSDIWYDNLKKWTSIGSQTKKLVYVYEWPADNKGTKYAYVGLTYNENKRDKQHNNDKVVDLSPVISHIQKTGVQPIKKVVSDGYIDKLSAGKLECSTMKDYEEKGWSLLNTAPCGGFGGVVNIRLIKNQFLDFFKEPNNTDINQLKNLPGGGHSYKMVVQPNNFDNLFYNKIKKIVKAYNIKSLHSLRFNFGDRRACSIIAQHDKAHPNDKWRVKLFNTESTAQMLPVNLNKFLENPNDTNPEQLKLISKNMFKIVTADIENKFLSKFKKIIDKNKIQFFSELPSGAYLTLWNHDKESNNSWKKFLLPNMKIQGKKNINESKLSLMGVLEQIL
jgi:hypothetical protein